MKNSEILRNARAKIEKPGTLSKYFLARNAEGSREHVQSKYAVCFCTVGAVIRSVAEADPEKRGIVFMFDSIAPKIFDALVDTRDLKTSEPYKRSHFEEDWRVFTIGNYSDNHDQPEVLEWVDRAIAKLEADND